MTQNHFLRVFCTGVIKEILDNVGTNVDQFLEPNYHGQLVGENAIFHVFYVFSRILAKIYWAEKGPFWSVFQLLRFCQKRRSEKIRDHLASFAESSPKSSNFSYFSEIAPLKFCSDLWFQRFFDIFERFWPNLKFATDISSLNIHYSLMWSNVFKEAKWSQIFVSYISFIIM